jgi:hypothetical protein
MPQLDSAAYFPFTASGTPTVNNQTLRRRLTGFFLVETAGSTASVKFRDGSVTGAIVLWIKLVSGESVGDLGDIGIELTAGSLYVEVVSGSVTGAVFGR